VLGKKIAQPGRVAFPGINEKRTGSDEEHMNDCSYIDWFLKPRPRKSKPRPEAALYKVQWLPAK
jgi:hypothetical protein